MLVVTSDYEEAVQVADRAVVMAKGRVVAELAGDEHHDRPPAGGGRRLSVADDEPGRRAAPVGRPLRAVGERTGRASARAGRPTVAGPLPETAALFVVLVVLFVFFSIASPYFIRDAQGNFSPDNIINIIQNAARIGIIACPATLLLIAGQFDLSVGSMAAFTAMVMALLAAPTGGLHPAAVRGRPPDRARVRRRAPARALLVGVINGISRHGASGSTR